MTNEFTVIIEDCEDGWFWAHSPEVPAANGQGRTPEEAKADLANAIELVLELLRDAADEPMPATSITDTVRVG
jgi:predicted RNase H-like HicB family nuclease